MDYQEAIKTIIKECCECPNFPPDGRKQMCHDGCMYGKDKCAFSIAISAMQELQLYKENKLCLIPDKVYKKQCEELDEYKALGTLEEVRAAVGKQRIMEVIDIHVDEYYCPACGSENNCNDRKVDDEYCPECGQHLYQELDWSEEV